MTEQEILNAENKLRNLKHNLQSLKIPQRTIAWQHQNLRRKNPEIIRNIRLVRRDRKKIQNNIKKTQFKLISLRESVIGESL